MPDYYMADLVCGELVMLYYDKLDAPGYWIQEIPNDTDPNYPCGYVEKNQILALRLHGETVWKAGDP